MNFKEKVNYFKELESYIDQKLSEFSNKIIYKTSIESISKAILLNHTCSFDDFNQKYYLDGEILKETRDFINLENEIEKIGFQSNLFLEKTIRKSFYFIANKNHFDSGLDFLTNLPEWDGKNRWEDLAKNLHISTENGWIWCQALFVGIVRRLKHTDGIDHKFIHILHSYKEDLNKNEFFKLITPSKEKFIEHLDITDKPSEIYKNIKNKSIVLFDEILGNSDKQDRLLNNLLDLSEVSYRSLYENLPTTYSLRCVFCSTTEHNDILQVDAGIKKFLITSIEKSINIDYVKENLSQFYAQALEEENSYDNLCKIWLNYINNTNFNFKSYGQFYEQLVNLDKFDKINNLRTDEILINLKLDPKKIDKSVRNALAKDLRSLNYIAKPKRIEGFLVKIWIKLN